MRCFHWFYLSFFLSLSLTACGPTQSENASTMRPPKPDSPVPYKQFISILADLHVAEAAVSMRRDRTAPAVKVYQRLEQSIFKKHETDSATFFSTYDYYMGYAKDARVILRVMKDTLKARGAAYTVDPKAVQQDTKSKLDSARKARQERLRESPKLQQSLPETSGKKQKLDLKNLKLKKPSGAIKGDK